MNSILENKLNVLKEYLKSLDSAAVAFSSGVDSTFLLEVARHVLYDNIIAFTAKSPLLPDRELKEAVEFCKNAAIKHKIIDINVFQIKDFCNNPTNRCYICKKFIFNEFIKIAKLHNIKNILEGSNIDDENDYRPGMQAVCELNIKSPLRIAGLTKNEIRILSKHIGLKTAEKPSFACLASRFEYGEKMTLQKLEMVQNAEEILFKAGFRQFRVRIHSNIARIEVLPDEFERLLKMREQIIPELKFLGFNYISMDLSGYRTGSMNEMLE